MRDEGCPPKELMDELADYYFDVVEAKKGSAHEYHVPEWVMERAVEVHERRGKRFKDYWWTREGDDEVERRVNGRRRTLLLELRAHTFK